VAAIFDQRNRPVETLLVAVRRFAPQTAETRHLFIRVFGSSIHRYFSIPCGWFLSVRALARALISSYDSFFNAYHAFRGAWYSDVHMYKLI
jgi:hypothetical protein